MTEPLSAPVPSPDHDQAERRWASVSIAILVVLVIMATFAAIHLGAMPQGRVETVDPRTLHLAGEFMEAT